MLPFGMLLFAATIYSMTFSLNRIAMIDGIPVVAFVFWQGLGTALLTFFAAVVTRQLPSLRRKYLYLYILFGSIGFAVPYTLLAFVAPKVPAGAIALGLTLTPMLTYIFSIFFRIDHVRLLRIIGILLGLGGILLVVIPGQSLPDPEMAPWLLMAFGATLCWAFCHVFIARCTIPLYSFFPLSGKLFFHPQDQLDCLNKRNEAQTRTRICNDD